MSRTYKDVFEFYFKKKYLKVRIKTNDEIEAKKELDYILQNDCDCVDLLELLGLYIIAYGQKTESSGYLKLMNTCKVLSKDDTFTSGCIRVSQENLNWLLENVDVGTTVIM